MRYLIKAVCPILSNSMTYYKDLFHQCSARLFQSGHKVTKVFSVHYCVFAGMIKQAIRTISSCSKMYGKRGGPNRSSRSGPQKDSVIVQVMSEQSIHPIHVPAENFTGPFDNLDNFRGSRRYLRVNGFAWFQQHGKPVCSHRWASVHAWCVVDLRDQVFVHMYAQKCKRCDQWNNKPKFEEEAKRRMAEHVCKIYLCRIGKLKWGDMTSPNMEDLSGICEGKHDEPGCEMCQILGRSCFTSRD